LNLHGISSSILKLLIEVKTQDLMTTQAVSGFVDANVQVSELSLDPQRADFSGTKILSCNVRYDNWIAVEHTLQEGRLSGTWHSERFRTSRKDYVYLFSSEFYCSFVQPALEEPKVLCKRGEFLLEMKVANCISYLESDQLQEIGSACRSLYGASIPSRTSARGQMLKGAQQCLTTLLL